jgi:hypothetical protein
MYFQILKFTEIVLYYIFHVPLLCDKNFMHAEGALHRSTTFALLALATIELNTPCM